VEAYLDSELLQILNRRYNLVHQDRRIRHYLSLLVYYCLKWNHYHQQHELRLFQ
jgi:hypothetical protein